MRSRGGGGGTGPQTPWRVPSSLEDSESRPEGVDPTPADETQSPSEFSRETLNARRQRNGISHLGGRGP